MKQFLNILVKLLSMVVKTLLTLAFLGILVSLLGTFVMITNGAGAKTSQGDAPNHAFTDRYNMFITNTLSDTLDGVLSIKKVYWLNDDDLVAPEPNQECFGTAKDASELQWLLDEASDLLDGQDTLFTTQTEIWEESQIQYYLDETILVITWRQVMDDAVYTISEVKIADPSQFRRFLAGGEYASGTNYYPSELAKSVNAVVASNGDFYSHRTYGIIVYDSQLMRWSGSSLDTCYIAGNGDLIFTHRGEVNGKEEIEPILQEHDVRFSLCFGPILIQNGELVEIKDPYSVGEGNIPYARAALCQRDELHYYLVTVTADPPFEKGHKLPTFQKNLYSLGCKHAYNLDGGQSGTIVMNDKVVNYVWQRRVSDIIYFATAIPDGD